MLGYRGMFLISLLINVAVVGASLTEMSSEFDRVL